MFDKKMIEKYNNLILEEKRKLEKIKEEYKKILNVPKYKKEQILLEIDIDASKRKIRFLVDEQKQYK